VSNWTQGFRSVEIINRAVTVIDGKSVSAITESVVKSDFPGCEYDSKNANAVRMHKVRSHGKKNPLQISSTIIDQNDAAAKKGRFACNVGKCTSIYDIARGLTMHKNQIHGKKTHAGYTGNVLNAVTLNTVKSTSHAEAVHTGSVVNKGRFLCDVRDCKSIRKISRTLANWQYIKPYIMRQKHMETVLTEVAKTICPSIVLKAHLQMSEEVEESLKITRTHELQTCEIFRSDKAVSQSTASMKIKKQHVKLGFSARTAELEKKILPTMHTMQTEDPRSSIQKAPKIPQRNAELSSKYNN